MASIKIESLSKKYTLEKNDFWAISSIDIDIEKKSFITIVGKSGSGKTTLLRLLCGLEKPTEGLVSYNNLPFNYQEPQNNPVKISMVFQEPRLMPWLTVAENMAFPLYKENNRNNVDNIINKYLELTGLRDFKHAYPCQISGGMAQRVALGRTLCYNPDVILMDEPFGALDTFNRRKLQDDLLTIFQNHKKTIVFVTHDIEEAVYLGQKIILMDNGNILKEFESRLAYPRKVNTKDFIDLRERILTYLMKGSVKSEKKNS